MNLYIYEYTPYYTNTCVKLANVHIYTRINMCMYTHTYMSVYTRMDSVRIIHKHTPILTYTDIYLYI